MTTLNLIRSGDCEGSPKNLRAETIALGLMGAAPLAPDAFAEGVGWERGSGETLMGREAILAVEKGVGLRKIEVSQVVTHGKAGAVSGRLWREDGSSSLFCYMLRFTSAAVKQVAHVVSFEHASKPG